MTNAKYVKFARLWCVDISTSVQKVYLHACMCYSCIFWLTIVPNLLAILISINSLYFEIRNFRESNFLMSCRCRSPFATRKMFLIFWASACRPIAVSYWCLLNNVAYLDRDWCVTHINVCYLIRSSLLTSSITKFRFSSYFIDIRWNTIRKHYFEWTNSPKTINLMELKVMHEIEQKHFESN